jgi:hypothetical protein
MDLSLATVVIRSLFHELLKPNYDQQAAHVRSITKG